MAAVLAGWGFWPLLHQRAPHFWVLAAAALLLALALARPRWLSVPHRWWLRLGNLLHGVMSPLALGVVFILGVCTTGLALRLFGKDPLRRRIEPAASTYWIEPPSSRPAHERLRKQF